MSEETPAQRRRRKKKERRALAKERRRRRRRWRRLRHHGRRLGLAGLVLAVVAGVGGLVWLSGAERRAASGRLGDLVVREPDRGRAHTPSRTSDPAPTSGPHSGAAICGVRGGPVPPDSQIHTLEHGGIVVQYRDEALADGEIQTLEGFVNEVGSHILVAPNPRLDTPVVLTAWTRKMRLESLDMNRVRDFYTAFQGQGPESVDCPA